MKRVPVSMLLIGSMFTLSLAATVWNQGVSANMRMSEENTTYEITTVETTVAETVSETETTTEELSTSETTTERETTTKEETTTKKSKKKKKKTKKKEESTTVRTVEELPTTMIEETTRKIETTTKKKEPVTKKVKVKETTKKEIVTTAKVNNTVPSYSESTKAIGSSNMNLIRNTIMGRISGSYSSNMNNLAIYMAKNGLSNAQSAVQQVCGNTTLQCSARCASATSPSATEEDISNAAEKLASKLAGGAGTYGIGINAYFSGGKYHIYAVVTTQK